jgi:hypothetical protein
VGITNLLLGVEERLSGLPRAGPGTVGDPCGLVPAGTAVTSLWP